MWKPFVKVAAANRQQNKIGTIGALLADVMENEGFFRMPTL